MSMVKGEVSKVVSGVSGIPADKQAATVETATSSLLGSLKGQLNARNLPGMLSAFGKGGTASAAKTNAIGGSVVAALTQKVGLKPEQAQKVASTVVPAVMSLFAKKVADNKEPGFNADSLLGGLGKLTGGAQPTSGGGIGKLFSGLAGLFKK